MRDVQWSALAPLEKALGHLDEEKLNIDGSAISIGHSVGTSGARLELVLY